MSPGYLQELLSGGDLRSDGFADEVVSIVLAQVELFDELLEGLASPDEVIRGRTADALEKITRKRPEMLAGHLPQLIWAGRSDSVAMVRWHMAMILGHLLLYPTLLDDIFSALSAMLQDKSVFVRSWAISSLAIAGRLYPASRHETTIIISEPQRSDSTAIRTRVRIALDLLADEQKPFPKGWCKSEHIDL